MRAHASEPTPPLIEHLSQAQLPSVTRCAPELQSIEVLGHDVGCHLEFCVGSDQQQVHWVLVLVVVRSSIRRRHIVRQHNSPAIPQAEPRELEPPT